MILEQSSEEFYTSHWGLALAGACIDRPSVLGRYVDRMAKGSDHIAEIDILRSCLDLLCLGKSDYQAIVAMREDDSFEHALVSAGFLRSNDCVSDSTRPVLH